MIQIPKDPSNIPPSGNPQNYSVGKMNGRRFTVIHRPLMGEARVAGDSSKSLGGISATQQRGSETAKIAQQFIKAIHLHD